MRSMKPGSVLVDLGADGGGNCILSKPGETVRVGGVTLLAPLNLPATLPYHASTLFAAQPAELHHRPSGTSPKRASTSTGTTTSSRAAA